MILTIDIGNTTIHFGVYERDKLTAHFSIATQPSRTPGEIAVQLKTLAKTHKLHPARAMRIIVCSVVPKMTAVLSEALKIFEAAQVRIVGQDLNVPLKNRYKFPEQVGQDRLVGAYAAWWEFGAAPQGRPARRSSERPRQRDARQSGRDCIVADFGTAITIDVVTKRGEYLGGVIAPGIGISLEALATRTALLPKVELREPPELLGRDTANSIRSGILYGCVALCNGLVEELKRLYVPEAVVVATGGNSEFIAKHSRVIDHLRPSLVLDGLHRLAKPSVLKFHNS